MGRRGEGWVLVQAALFALFLFAPRLGPGWPDSPLFFLFGAPCALAGGALAVWSARKLGAALTPFPRPLPQGRLVTGGAYRLVRHPIYFAILVFCLGVALWSASTTRLLLLPVFLIFFDLKSRREEIWLRQQYPDYAAYQARVKKLLPGIY